MTTLHWVQIGIIALSVELQEVLLLIQRNNQFILVDTAICISIMSEGHLAETTRFSQTRRFLYLKPRLGSGRGRDPDSSPMTSSLNAGSGGEQWWRPSLFYDGLISAGPVSNFGLQDVEIFQ